MSFLNDVWNILVKYHMLLLQGIGNTMLIALTGTVAGLAVGLDMDGLDEQGHAGSSGPGFEVRGVALVAHAVDADMEGGDAPAAAGATGGLTEQDEQGEGVFPAREAEQDMVALADKAEMAHAF